MREGLSGRHPGESRDPGSQISGTPVAVNNLISSFQRTLESILNFAFQASEATALH